MCNPDLCDLGGSGGSVGRAERDDRIAFGTILLVGGRERRASTALSKCTTWTNRGSAGGPFLRREFLRQSAMQASRATCAVARAVGLSGIGLMFSLAKSGWSTATGPSMSPTTISGLPLVRSRSAVRRTKSIGVIQGSLLRTCV